MGKLNLAESRYDQYLNVTDPLKITPKMIEINESSIVQFYINDYSDNCIASRSYNIDSNNTMKHDIQLNPYIFESVIQTHPYIFGSLFNSYNNSNYIYINQRYDFQLEYPNDWFSVTQDIFDDSIPLNDPIVVSIYPKEVLNHTGLSDGLSDHIPPHVTIAVEDKGNWYNPEIYLRTYFDKLLDLKNSKEFAFNTINLYS